MAAEKNGPVNFADCYVLTDRRTEGFIRLFLDHFLPGRQEYTDTYEVPQFAERPVAVFHSAGELVGWLEQHPQERHAIYWYNSEDVTLRGAMALFTSDGRVILGLFCETLYPDTANEDHYLQAIMDFCGSTEGLIEYATPAAKDAQAFLQRVEAYRRNRQ
ncbi:hypothetical protein V9K67_20280 [Paraflavisolibacter sp. H34]|uniref:hypothetical protein n=1 Tax=Huijunlia imazamoxiresistens TaxID=3127457 RepID=UPI00301AB85A